MQKSAFLAAFLLCALLLSAQAPQYFFQKLDCETGNTMCFDADSNIWLGCSRAGQPLLVKMSRAGILLEQVQVSTQAGSKNPLTELIVDSEGMIVGCGTAEPINPNDPESSFAFRYDPKAQQMLWSRKLIDGYLFLGGIMEQGAGGDFWAYGNSGGTTGPSEMFRLERNTGTLVPGSARYYQAGNLEDIRSALYHKGKFYTAGKNDLSYLYGITVGRYLRQSVMQIDTTGLPIWTLFGSVPLIARSSLAMQDLLVENDTLVSLASGDDLSNSTTTSNLFLQKTTLDGQLVWLKKLDVVADLNERGKEIVSVPDGYVILGRNATGEVGDFIIKTDKNGNVLWAQRLVFTASFPFDYSGTQSQLMADGDALYYIGNAWEGQNRSAIFAKIDRNGNIAGCNRLSPLTVLPVPLVNSFFEKRTLGLSTAGTTSDDIPTELPTPAQLGIQIACQNEGPAPQNPCEPRTFLRRFGTQGQRQWVTCVRTAPDTTLYLAGRKGDIATLSKMRPDGELLWTKSLPSVEPLTITDLLVNSGGQLLGCGHRGDVATGRTGFAFRYDPATGQMLWFRNLDSPIVSGGGMAEVGGANGNLLLYQNVLLPDGRQVPESIQLDRATGNIVSTTGRRYDSETHSQVFNAAVPNGNDWYAVGQDVTLSGRRRMLLSNLTVAGGGQKWLQVGHTDTTANGSFGGYGSVLFDQGHMISAYTGHPTANNNATPTQLFLQKTAQLGTVVWVRRYEVALLGELDMLAVPGGYVLMGKTSPTQYALLKTDLNGNLLAVKQVDLGTASGTPVFLEKTQHRIALLGEYLFFVLHDGRADVAFLLKTDLNLEVQGPCNGVATISLASGNVAGPVARRLSQGLFVSPLTTAPLTAAWEPDDLAVAQICPPLVSVPRLALGPDLELCPGKTDTLQAPVGFVSYLWQDSTAANTLIVGAAGMYTVATTDICGRVQRDTVMVTMLSNPTKSVTLALKPNSSVNLAGNLYFAPDTVTIAERSKTGGCDTLTTYFLQLCPTKTGADTILFYPGQKVSLGGNNYTQPGTVALNFFTPDGCDSIVTYTLQWIITSLNLQCPADLTVNVPPSTDRVAVDYTVPGFTTDCPNPDVGLALLEGPFAGDTFSLGITKVCYTAVSPCGIRDTCCFRVTVLPPALLLNVQCPAPLTVTVPTSSSTVVVNYAMPSTTTDCSDPSVSLTLLQGQTSGAAFPVGNTQVCYEAANTCGIRDTCCFAVRVLLAPPDPPCDVKTPPGCIRYELLAVRLDSLGQRRYRVRMVNTCASPLRFAYLQLPNGAVAVSPKQGATYAAPSGNTYAVRNPNASPFYSVRYEAVVGNVSGGVGDVFEYTLPQQAVPGFLHVAARLADGSYSEAYLNVQVCPVEVYSPPLGGVSLGHSPLGHSDIPTFGPHPSPLTPHPSPLTPRSSPLTLWPNPTSGRLLVDLSAWRSQPVQVQVLNGQGQLVFSVQHTAESEAFVLDLPAGLASGLYYLRVVVSGQRPSPAAGQRPSPAATARFVLER